MIEEGGKIKLFCGPMFSGKSTTLVHKVKKYNYKNKKTILVNFADDQRYDNNGNIVTHEHQITQAIACHKLTEIINTLMDYDVIGIDEGHFFPDLVEICETLCNNGKIVLVAALSGDFKMEPFSNVSKLISKADKIKLLKAYCAFCLKSAHFTLRTVKNDKTFLVGSSEIYKPVCKSCYFQHNVNKEDDLK